VGLDPELVREMEGARVAFWLCFFGASGSAAIGRAVIPLTYGKYQETVALKGVLSERSLGGDKIPVGYPDDVYAKDVQKVVQNTLNIGVENIVKKFPIEGRPRSKVFLVCEALQKANPRIPPMATRAVFDSFSYGLPKASVPPVDAINLLEIYRDSNDPKFRKLVDQISYGRTVGATAFFTLLAIIGLADWFAFYHLWRGFFPLWQGLSELPTSLFDERGILAIPKFWV